MSGSTATNLQEKVGKRAKVGEWFNNLFKTKLEIDAAKLLKMLQGDNDNEPSASAAFYNSRGGLEKDLETYLGAKPKYMVLKELGVTYWCDVPQRLYDEFQNDAKFLSDLQNHLKELTGKLVAEWGKRAIVWERNAAAADKKGDKAGVTDAMKQFEKECVTIQAECEKIAAEDIALYFQTKVQTYANYKRYKVKAGAKLAFTFVGIIVSIVSLSTAATPAAPATIVPALIGLAVSVASVGKQIRDLSQAAEGVAQQIETSLGKLECNYKDKDGKAKKKTYKAMDLSSGFVGGMTGGWSEIKFPSVNSMMGLTDQHSSKLDGLDVRMHDMGNGINALIEGMMGASKILEDNIAALNEALKKKPGDPAIKKADKVMEESKAIFDGLNTEFLKLFETDIPEMDKRLKEGRDKNELWKLKLEQINEALGSKNYAIIGGIFATLALTGIGFSGGLPSNAAEAVTTPLSGAVTGADMLREYVPEVMDKLLGKKG